MKIKHILFVGLIGLFSQSCINDLDVTPIDPNILTTEQIYASQDNYIGVLAKCYAAYSLSGQQGPSGEPDLMNFDEGYSSFIRLGFYVQDLSTDEAVMGSQTNGLREMTTMSWNPNTAILNGYYARLYQIVGYVNEFLRQTTEDKLNQRGHNDVAFKQKVETFRTEAKFLRAYAYWVLMDTFGNVPFVTDADSVSPQFLPNQISRENLYKYVESELLEVEKALPVNNEYGRVDKTAADFLLSRLYLNSKVYIGQEKWQEALTYSEKVINSRYTLAPNYLYNFLADNNTSNEIIWALPADGVHSKSYGATTFFVLAQTGGTMLANINIGISGGWGNIRLLPDFVNKFDIADQTFNPADQNAYTKNDTRALLYTTGHTKEVPVLPGTFQQGYAYTKWRNVTKDGVKGSDGAFVDTDYPMFRLAEAYLTAAEAALRLGTKTNEALNYVNTVRNRAYKNGNGEITTAQLNLDFILDERGRELAWELIRRTDLIRYNKFTSSDYVWAWKGYVLEGKGVDAKYNLFPLPSADITANPKLVQNPGY